MPNRPRGARLYLRRSRIGGDGSPRQALWVIRDGRLEESTGCGEGDLHGAEVALEAYLNRRHVTQSTVGSRRPDQIAVADVLALYGRDVIPRMADPTEARRRGRVLLSFFEDKMLSDINGDLCRAYVTFRSGKAIARRELEDLRAAINFHREEGHCSEIVGVALPERNEPRDRFLTREEAARAVWCAWRYREKQNLRATDRRTRRHIARLLLIGLYTGTRPGTIIAAALQPEAGRPWFDLERGVFYRKPAAKRATKKRQPPIPVPDRLLAHLRRWRAKGQRYAIEFNGQPVSEVRHAFAAVMLEAGIDDATPHVIRHTAVTWAMLAGADLYQAGRFFGLTPETLDRVYGHHHPEHLSEVKHIMNRSRPRFVTKLDGTEQERSASVPVVKARKAANVA